MSCPYTPQQIGRAERKPRHLTETGLAMLFGANVPATFGWTLSLHLLILHPSFPRPQSPNPIPTSQLTNSASSSSTEPVSPIISPVASSADDQSSSSVASSHAMVTWGKAGIVKTKHIFNLLAVSPTHRHVVLLVANEPKGFKSASKYLHCPVVKATTVHIVLSFAVTNHWHLHQLDVKNAFLNGDIRETVYMEQPPGYVDSRNPNYVCRLNKAFYGLKQAQRAWFQRLSNFLVHQGFKCSQAYTSVFVFHRRSFLLCLLVYVDDMILTGNHEPSIKQFIDRLQSEFAIKDSGNLSYFLGLEVSHTSNGLFLSQTKYAHDILHRAGLLDSKPVGPPLATQDVFTSTGTAFHNPLFIDHLLVTPMPTGLAVLKLDVPLTGTQSSLVAISSPGVPKSDLPFLVRVASPKTGHAMANTAVELIWITHLLRDLNALPSNRFTLLCDNLSAIFLSQNPVAHRRANI
ncbi:retrovirus-related pol polyprotein from transposon RE1 [Tanacetum coccineum]